MSDDIELMKIQKLLFLAENRTTETYNCQNEFFEDMRQKEYDILNVLIGSTGACHDLMCRIDLSLHRILVETLVEWLQKREANQA